MSRLSTLGVVVALLVAACGSDEPDAEVASSGDVGTTGTAGDGAPASTADLSTTTTVPATTADSSTTAPAPPPLADSRASSTTAPASLDESTADAAVTASTTVGPPTTTPATTVPPTTVSPTTVPPTTAPSTTVPPTTAAAPAFTHSVRAVTAEQLGVSWREGCPVPVADLRWIDLRHWNDNGDVVTGSLVVHTDHAVGVVQAFSRIYDARFPIHSMRPITDFDGSDDASMAANNTSAFNCREISGSPGVWSQHAYGGAVDINPLLNPWVRGSTVDPPTGARYVDRTLDVPGLIRSGDAVTAAFAAIGWGWGGNWSSTKDYQHFSHNGR